MSRILGNNHNNIGNQPLSRILGNNHKTTLRFNHCQEYWRQYLGSFTGTALLDQPLVSDGEGHVADLIDDDDDNVVGDIVMMVLDCKKEEVADFVREQTDEDDPRSARQLT